MLRLQTINGLKSNAFDAENAVHHRLQSEPASPKGKFTSPHVIDRQCKCSDQRICPPGGSSRYRHGVDLCAVCIIGAADNAGATVDCQSSDRYRPSSNWQT
jgi:hypothetical protein